MAKAVVYSVIPTAFLFLFLINPCPLHLHHEQDDDDDEFGDLGRNRRFGYDIADLTPNLDLLVTKIEREASDKKMLRDSTDSVSDLENSRLTSEVSETYLYLTAGAKLNTTLRLTLLFPLLDRDSKDGLVSYDELEAWILQQALERLNYLTQIEMESKDRDGDSSLSFGEYFPHFSHEDIERGEMGIGEAGWWHQRFTIADIDHNGSLNFTELRDFLHPEDSNNEEMLQWMLRDRLMRISDGNLKLREFEDHLYDRYKKYVAFETAGAPVPDAQHKFAELDKNNDQFLTGQELKPILHYLYPGEISYARLYTSYLMNEADDNKDWKLSLEEMLRHENIFYNTVHVDGQQEKHYHHDEL